MIKHQKQESIGPEVSQEGSLRLDKKSRIKKRPKSRQITHYFAKVQQKASSSHQLPVINKIDLQQQDQRSVQLVEDEIALIEKRDNLLIQLQAQKEERDHYMMKVRSIMSLQLKKMAQIERIFQREKHIIISQKQQQHDRLKQSIENIQILLLDNKTEGLQRFFLQKQKIQLAKESKKIEHELAQLLQQQRLCIEEQGCYFSKQGWPLVAKKYQIQRLIGKGGFSQVYSAYDLQNNRQVAIKVSDVEHLLAGRGNKNDYLRHIKRQYKVHKQLSHPHIIQLLEVLEFDNAICIVLEYCNGQTLAQMLQRQQRLPENIAKMIIKTILEVIRYLSLLRPSVVHYDLKPQNIMFNKGCPKVLDFGICKTIDNEHSKMALTSQGIGTHCYLPPQTFATNNPLLTNKVDVWSAGVIFFEMLFGYRPSIQSGQSGESIEFPQQLDISPQAKMFIKGCLQTNISLRYDPVGALNSSYFS